MIAQTYDLQTLEIKRPEFALEVLDWNALEKVPGYKPTNTLTMRNSKSTLLFFKHDPQLVVKPSNAFGFTEMVHVLGNGSRFVSTGTVSEHYTEINDLPVAPAPEWVLANLNNPNIETIVGVTHRNMKEYLEEDQTGDGKLFADMYRERVVFDVAADKWFVWTGNYWEEDWGGDVWNMVSNMVAAEYISASAEAKRVGNDELSKRYYKRSCELKNKSRVVPVLEWAAKQEGMRLRGNEWDTNPMVLGVGNGVVDLKSGDFAFVKPTDYLKAHSDVDWKGLDCPAPNWEKFMLEIMDGDDEMVSFLQRLFGYSITGVIEEHVFPILQGEGGNGKSTMMSAIGHVLGKDLAYTIPAGVLMDSKTYNSDGKSANPFVYALRGKRLVWATESKQGARLDTAGVKVATGGDQITTRDLYQGKITFDPTHKIMLVTNPKPHITADDDAIWRRVFLIEFKRKYVDTVVKEGQLKADAKLPKTLKEEESGILAWLVRGCIEWQKQGLNPPEKIIVATLAYREEEDTVGNFINECLISGTAINSTVQQIYNRYKAWCLDGGLDPMNRNSLSKKLRLHFGEPKPMRDGTTFIGVSTKIGQL